MKDLPANLQLNSLQQECFSNYGADHILAGENITTLVWNTIVMQFVVDNDIIFCFLVGMLKKGIQISSRMSMQHYEY